MEQEQHIQPFGYAEMFEWKNIPDQLKDNGAGLFVQFSESEPDKIEPYNGGTICGVTTSSFASLSDNPIEWPGQYETTETGAYVREKKYIAVGNKVYEQQQELNIVRTFPYKIYKKKQTEEYDARKSPYNMRINRIEWTPVCIQGKCLVRDDGSCEPGGWCAPLEQEDYSNAGIVSAVHPMSDGYYVLKRVSENVVLILMK